MCETFNALRQIGAVSKKINKCPFASTCPQNLDPEIDPCEMVLTAESFDSSKRPEIKTDLDYKQGETFT